MLRSWRFGSGPSLLPTSLPPHPALSHSGRGLPSPAAGTPASREEPGTRRKSGAPPVLPTSKSPASLLGDPQPRWRDRGRRRRKDRGDFGSIRKKKERIPFFSAKLRPPLLWTVAIPASEVATFAACPVPKRASWAGHLLLPKDPPRLHQNMTAKLAISMAVCLMLALQGKRVPSWSCKLGGAFQIFGQRRLEFPAAAWKGSSFSLSATHLSRSASFWGGMPFLSKVFQMSQANSVLAGAENEEALEFRNFCSFLGAKPHQPHLVPC